MKDFIKKCHRTNLLIFLLITSTSVAKANIFTLTINEELANCTGMPPKVCYQVKYSNSENWETFYSEILGFKYESGYRYLLKVNRIKRKNIPADGSAYAYRLVGIVKRKKMAKRENSALTFIAKHRCKLIQLDGKTLENTTAFLIFDAKKNRINGNTGCNTLMGSFKIGETIISFGPLSMTRMFCDGESSELENAFTKTLAESSLSYDIADQTLNFYKNDKLVIMFGMTPLENN